MLPHVSRVPGSRFTTAPWTLFETRIYFLFSWRISNGIGPATAFWADWERVDWKYRRVMHSSHLLRKESFLCCESFTCLSQPDIESASYFLILIWDIYLWASRDMLSSPSRQEVGCLWYVYYGVITNSCLALQLCKAFGALPNAVESIQLPYLFLFTPLYSYYFTLPFRSSSSILSSWCSGSIPVNLCQQLRSM